MYVNMLMKLSSGVNSLTFKNIFCIKVIVESRFTPSLKHLDSQQQQHIQPDNIKI
jgi:hypothetical protein